MRIYVTLQPAPDKPCGKTVYALLLPDGGEWGEVDVRKSAIEGFGVFPRNTQLLKWSALDTPVLMYAALKQMPATSAYTDADSLCVFAGLISGSSA